MVVVGGLEVMELSELLQRPTGSWERQNITPVPKKICQEYEDIQGLQYELFGTGRIFWDPHIACHKEVLVPAGTQVASVNSLSSAGLVCPKTSPVQKTPWNTG